MNRLRVKVRNRMMVKVTVRKRDLAKVIIIKLYRRRSWHNYRHNRITVLEISLTPVPVDSLQILPRCP